MRRSILVGIETVILLALIATALPADAAPKVAMIEVKGMVCSG